MGAQIGNSLENSDLDSIVKSIDAHLSEPVSTGTALPLQGSIAETKNSIVVKGESFVATVNPPRAEPGLSLGGLMNGMLGGKVTPEVRNALSIGTDSQGGYTVPEFLVADFIDNLRAKSVAFRAGAMAMPLYTNSTVITRLDSDPTFAWRAEAGAVSESDPSFSAITLVPKSVAVLVKASNELLQDSVNIEDVLFHSLVNAAATAVDQAVLSGTGSGNQPTGILNTSNINTVDMSSASPNNGAAITDYDPLLDALYEIDLDNANEPTALVMHPRTRTAFSKLKDSENRQLTPPWEIVPDTGDGSGIPYLKTTSMAIDETVGSSTNASSIIVGDFSQVIVGIRQDFQLEVLRELYRENLQTGFIAHLRLDVAVTRPEHFCRVQGIIPA